MATVLLLALPALGIGVLLGLLGGGGAILTVPLLVYVAGLEPRTAIAMSLLVVGGASAVGAVAQAASGTVCYRVGAIFGVAGMAGAFAGGRLAHFVPGPVLLVTFASVALITALAMMRGRPEPSPSARGRGMPLPVILALGGAVGLLSGLVGVGGGFMIVPALTMLGGYSVRDAIGTSLFIIALQSLAGFAGHHGQVVLDGQLLAAVMPTSIAGAVGGTWIGRRLPVAILRKAFAWLVVGIGLFVIAKQTSLVIGGAAGVVMAIAIVVLGRPAPAP